MHQRTGALRVLGVALLVLGWAACAVDSVVLGTRCSAQVDARLLVYNRVPKTGSSTTIERLRLINLSKGIKEGRFAWLPIRNTLDFTGTGKSVLPSQAWAARLVAHINASSDLTDADSSQIWLVHGHFPFLGRDGSFTKGTVVEKAVYVNIVRHPVTQIVSQYQYLMSSVRGSRINDTKINLPSVNLDDCVADILRSKRGRPAFGSEPRNTSLICDEGQFDRSQIRYFCGYHNDCFSDSPARRLAIAKSNLKAHFALVGLSEEYDLTFRALEALLPQFFRPKQYSVFVNPAAQNASDGGNRALQQLAEMRLGINVNTEKSRPRPETVRALHRWMEERGELEFYHYAASVFWDKIQCIIDRYWRMGHAHQDSEIFEHM